MSLRPGSAYFPRRRGVSNYSNEIVSEEEILCQGRERTQKRKYGFPNTYTSSSEPHSGARKTGERLALVGMEEGVK